MPLWWSLAAPRLPLAPNFNALDQVSTILLMHPHIRLQAIFEETYLNGSDAQTYMWLTYRLIT